MTELRLVPTALLVWAVTLLVLLTRGSGVAVVVILGAGVLALLLGQHGQAVLLWCGGAVSLGFGHARLVAVQAHEFGSVLHGVLTTAPKEISPGTWILRVRVTGHPAPVPTVLHADTLPVDATVGARVQLPVSLADSDRAGLGEVLARATDLEVAQAPSGMNAFALHVRECFALAVVETVGPASTGLLPGMVLGDTSLQSAAETQLYLDTGLSHLSAVSGANVAIVTTSIILLCRWLTLGPRIQTFAATVALLFFVSLVGPEPSVLRAAVTGLVGLVAVLNSARMEPVHALSLAVIGLLLYDSDLAVSYGFALSVVATAGIVVLNPLLVSALARTRWPEILVRALAVAIAADLVTMPLIAMMSGRISLVAVLANVLVSPVVAPVTVLGLLAAGLSLLPGGLAYLPLKLCEPCTWWIHRTAEWCAGFPLATIPTPEGWLGPVWVLTLGGWVIAAFLFGHPRKVILGMGVIYLWSWSQSWVALPAEISLEHLQLHVIERESQIDPVPPGTQTIIVLDPKGDPAPRPSRTRAGLPVLYPNRDGAVSLHIDGSQHAEDRRF